VKALLAVSIALLTGCGPSELVLSMNAENNSNQNGTATLTETAKGLNVRIELNVANDGGNQAVHLHPGRCGELGPPLAQHPDTELDVALPALQNGVSERLWEKVRLSEVTGRRFALNVHFSNDLLLYVSCGNIP
jgi:hypothetical protein